MKAIAIHYFRCVTYMDDSKVWHILFVKSFLHIFLQGMCFRFQYCIKATIDVATNHAVHMIRHCVKVEPTNFHLLA